MGMNHLGVFEVGELGARFRQEREGEVVRLQAGLFHLTKEKEGFLWTALVYGFPYSGVPCNNGRKF